jgi:transposase
MMGERTVSQEALFYSFSLERHVPADHLLRSIDRFVDLSSVREHLRPFYSQMGRPSIDPELMIRMLIIGYCMGIWPCSMMPPSAGLSGFPCADGHNG